MVDDSVAERFHAHLDVCERCRNHPFDLCAYGVVLIQTAAWAIAAGGATVAPAEPEEKPPLGDRFWSAK